MKVEKNIHPLTPALETGRETRLETELAQDALYGESGYYVHTTLKVGKECPLGGEPDKNGNCYLGGM
jgi:hypothetical protein